MTECSVSLGLQCGEAYALKDSAGITPVDEATKEMCGQIIYPAAVMKAAPHADAAQAFLDYLRTEDAGAVFESVGFTAL